MPAPTFAPISHDRVSTAVETIAGAIEADPFAPDLIVGIGRGGLVPATFLSHRLGLPMVSIDLSAAVSGFGVALLPGLAAAGRRLLLVDDINDSGGTIASLRRALPAVDLRVAVLIDNVRSAAAADYCGETIDRTHEHRWFVFPWEAIAPRATIAADAVAVPERLG